MAGSVKSRLPRREGALSPAGSARRTEATVRHARRPVPVPWTGSARCCSGLGSRCRLPSSLCPASLYDSAVSHRSALLHAVFVWFPCFSLARTVCVLLRVPIFVLLSLANSLMHSFIQKYIPLFVHSHLLTHSLTHSLT